MARGAAPSTRDLVVGVVPCRFRATLPLKGAGDHDTFLVDLPALALVRPADEDSPGLPAPRPRPHAPLPFPNRIRIGCPTGAVPPPG